MNPRVLLVDDEPQILSGLRRNLRHEFSIETAEGGEVALRLLDQSGPFAVVVADMRMPGMNGLDLLQQVMDRAPDTVRVMLTGDGDQQTAIDAVNRGQVFRFLTKPCPQETLELSLRASVRQYRLIRAERELLENTLDGSIRVLTETLALLDSDAYGRTQTVRDYARPIARRLGLASTWELDLAAMLCRIGMVSVPPSLAQKLHAGIGLSGVEKDIIARVPQVGSELLANIPRLQGVSRIVLYQAKNFDGSGFPHDTLRGEDIPIEARLLRILLDLTSEESRRVPAFRALSRMAQTHGLYDPALLEAVIRSFGAESLTTTTAGASIDSTTGSAPRALTLADVRPGDLLASDISTVQGLLIVARGTRVTPLLLQRLRSFADLSGVTEPILVTSAPQSESTP